MALTSPRQPCANRLATRLPRATSPARFRFRRRDEERCHPLRHAARRAATRAAISSRGDGLTAPRLGRQVLRRNSDELYGPAAPSRALLGISRTASATRSSSERRHAMRFPAYDYDNGRGAAADAGRARGHPTPPHMGTSRGCMNSSYGRKPPDLLAPMMPRASCRRIAPQRCGAAAA